MNIMKARNNHMDNLKYLEHVVELGKVQAATTPEEMSGAFDAFNGFLGLYYDLAKMELQKAGIDTPPIRNFAIDKALERIDARLDCADFTIPALIRMLREHRGTRLNEEQAQKIEQSLIHFKYWLDEPGDVHACFFTENHQILYHSAEYLVGQMYPDVVFPNNGMTGAEHHAHATAFLRRWLNWRERFGFSEWLTQGYYMDDMLGLVNLMIYADEADIRTRCRMLIDMLVFDLAVNHFEGHLPTTHGRVYTRFIIEPDYEDCSAVMALLFDKGYAGTMSNCAVMLAANGYVCPKAILAAAAAPTGIQTNRERMSIDVVLGATPKDARDLPARLNAYGAEKAAVALGVGVPTLRDIAKELSKPGRDPRDELPAPILRTDVLDIKDLKPGMVLTGTVRNVIDFGVFVDIGVHQDGLVHISQVCNKFIKHPSEAVAVGDVVKVVVLDVDEKKHRISLSMKQVPEE